MAVLALLQLDALVLQRSLALAFARWSDRLLLAATLALLAVLRPPDLLLRSPWLLAALVFGLGCRLTWLLLEWVERQGEVGVIAVASLHPGSGAAYVLFWLSLAGLVLFGASVWLALPIAPVAGGWAGGAGLAALTRLALRRAGRGGVSSRAQPGWRRAAARYPAAGLLAGLPVLAVVMLGAATGGWDGTRENAVVACLLAVVVALLIPIDNASLRHEALAGRSVMATVRGRLAAALTAIVLVLVGVAVWQGAHAVLLPAVLAALVLGVQLLRLLLHRMHRERAAEWLAAATLTVGALLALAVPPVLIVAIPLTAVRLWRSAERDRWLLST